MPTLEEIGDEIYQLVPANFVAARNAHVAALKKSGEKELAAQVAALRRPTTLGWLVNLVALRRPDLIEGWLAFGNELRQAQTGLVGGEVRRLATDRRALLTELLGQVTALATEAGHTGPVPVNEVSTTLTSALADPGVAAQVRTGRVLGAASYAGFGQAPEDTWGESTKPAPRERATSTPKTTATAAAEAAEADDADDAPADDEIEAATAALAGAQAELESARAEEAEAKQELDDLTEQLTDLESRVREAQRRRGAATTGRQDAERAVAEAREILRRVMR